MKMLVDSGAVNSIAPRRLAPKIKSTEGELMREGVKYRVADGGLIPNEGEKYCVGYSTNGTPVKIVMQVADVTRPLLAVSELCKAGKRVSFEGDMGYIECPVTGHREEFKRENGAYIYEMWMFDVDYDEELKVTQPFSRQD